MAKSVLLFVSIIFYLNIAFGQSVAWIEPELPVNLNDVVSIYVDVSHPDCECPNLVDVFEDLYIWTWIPGDPPGGNGDWDASNINLAFAQESANLYRFDMIPTDFFDTSAAAIYDQGISFLIKKYNGADVDGSGEAKSVDLHLDFLLTGIQTSFLEQELFQVSPNPGTDHYTFRLPNKTSAHAAISIYSSNGTIIDHFLVELSKDQIGWSFPKNHSKGLYLVRLQVENEIYTTRLIKQ